MARPYEEENKQDILDALCECLQLTRDQYDLEALIYHEDSDEVTIAWSDGGTSVNVAYDSGIAMIRDVLRALQ